MRPGFSPEPEGKGELEVKSRPGKGEKGEAGRRRDEGTEENGRAEGKNYGEGHKRFWKTSRISSRGCSERL